MQDGKTDRRAAENLSCKQIKWLMEETRNPAIATQNSAELLFLPGRQDQELEESSDSARRFFDLGVLRFTVYRSLGFRVHMQSRCAGSSASPLDSLGGFRVEGLWEEIRV